MMPEDDPPPSTTYDGGGTADGVANAFARSGMVMRSPTGNQVAVFGSSNVGGAPDGTGEKSGLGLSLLFTPKASGSQNLDERQVLQFGRTKLTEAKKKVDELYEFIKEKHNVHHKIRDLVTGIKSCLLAAEREQQAWRMKAEMAEKKLKQETAKLMKAKETPNEVPNAAADPRAGKRDRDTPGEDEVAKKQKEDKEEVKGKEEDGSAWQTVENKKEKKEKKEKQKKEQQKKGKPRRERSKGDALVIEVKDGSSYADLLRKVRADPELKQLGENVVKTRRTQKGEMLFELKKDPTVRSSTFKSLVEKSLGEEANVRALSQETVIECRDLDEITTVEEVKRALTEHCGDVPMAIRLRKAYGGTQTAVIRLSPVVANKLLEIGQVRVGWSFCPLRAIPRSTKQMERCFKCMGFGHYARNCEGPDRSKRCRKCGKEGHLAID